MRLWGRLGASTFVLFVASCQSAATPGAACTRTADCAAPLTCAFDRCRSACIENRDCPAGSSCLPSTTGNVCTVETDLGCETGVGRLCPTGLICVGDRCAATCASGSDCPADGECLPGPTPGISFCYDARLAPIDAGASIDAGPTDDANTQGDTGSGDAGPSDAGVSGCVSVCVQAGDDGSVGERACALCGGAVYCWGYDGDDGLGDGPPRMAEGTPRMVRDVSGVPLAQVRSLACGAQHACAVRIDGRLWCWGADPDGHGSLGDPGGSDHARLASATSALSGIDAVFAGQFHTCVTHGAMHYLACFGENAQGQVDPTQGYVVADPAPATAHPIGTASMPFGAGGSELFGAGLGRTCSVATMTGQTNLRCAGLAEDGNCGGSDALHTATTSDAIDLGGAPVAITFGLTHECFIRAGQLFCLGGDDFGALGAVAPSMCGTALSPCARTPVAVDSSARDFLVVGSGPYSFHTCAAGPTGVSCWGRNDHHQCGATSGDVSAPLAVPELASAHITAIATGVTSTCVVADGAVYCWGNDDHGQLGLTPGADSAVPIHVVVP